MKKYSTVVMAVFLGLVFSSSAIYSYEKKEDKLVAIEKFKTVQEEASSVGIQEETKAEEAKAVEEVKATPKNTGDSQRASRTVASRGTTTAPVKSTPSKGISTSKYGELLDWWTQAGKIFSIGSVAEVTDIRTGRSFKVKRTMGSNHADCEALTKADADIIRSIWGGFSWDRRAVVVNVRGRKIAASMTSLPHAGVDSAPAFAVVDNRSEGYGRGENLDVIKGNGMNGHFDIHFLNSRRHKDNRVDLDHQALVKKAAGK